MNYGLNCGTEKACNDCTVSKLHEGELRDEVLCALSAIAGTHFRSGEHSLFVRATDVDEARERAHFVLSNLVDDDDYVTSEQRQAMDLAIPHIVSGECIA